MLRLIETLFVAIAGLSFGSFLNVCLIRWPQEESIVKPGSHCRNCSHVLSWWENMPLLSWILLRGRCHECKTPISARYPLVEAAIAVLWVYLLQGQIAWLADPMLPTSNLLVFLFHASIFVGSCLFAWFITALSLLDAEYLWLPDLLTISGAVLGLAFRWTALYFAFNSGLREFDTTPSPLSGLLMRLGEALFAAGIILLIRGLYWLIRRKEGLGLGDAKLMALLAAWMGLPLTLVAFVLGMFIATLTAVALFFLPRNPEEGELVEAGWAGTMLPLGTFLCIGALISYFWGMQILDLYLHWAGLR